MATETEGQHHELGEAILAEIAAKPSTERDELDDLIVETSHDPEAWQAFLGAEAARRATQTEL